MMLELDALIGAVPAEATRRLEFYEVLYGAAARIAAVDAFYACLYDETSDTLYFPCNWEGTHYDTCEIKKPGGGPTSWVIRNRRTYTLTEDHGTAQRSGNRFGDTGRVSRSAIHSPLLAFKLDGRESLLGVLSMQSYEADAYDALTICLFEWLARRAAAALQRDRDVDDLRATALSRRLQEQANEFNRVLQTVTRRADEVHSMTVHTQDAALHSAVLELRRACHQARASAVMHAYLPEYEPPIEGAEPDPFARLTPQERKVLLGLCHHLTYEQIALQLSIESSTVKSHVASVLRKLDVANRAEAARLAEPFLGRHQQRRR